MSSNNIHDEWLSLVEVTGPFLAPPVLNEAFPQGLDLLDPGKRKRLRQTYEEWREALDSEDPEFLKIHQAWIKEVISNCLGFNEDSKGTHLKFGDAMPPALVVQIPEQGITLSPEYALVDEQQSNKPLLLVQSYASGVDLQAAMSVDGWSATPADRMVQLCRSTGCRLGLVTDGERWMLIDAPVGAVTTFASWYARLWIQEPITLQAFVHLLGIRRFFVVVGEQIPALIDKSLQHQDEVTTALGEQVQRAVEVLIQSLDRADQDRNRELLEDVTPAELYEAGLTVMMRLVFLLSAEERGLLLMGDEAYEKNYAISTLRMQLRSESEEILERRWDAWSRLLSVFRAVYGGIDHENMRLPALGGSLFDPDRFPFLEGRAKGSNWLQESAKPLPIDNRTVLLLLEAIQQYQGRSLSYRALDVEQIGYVYEGLLERTVKRTSEVILDVGVTRSAEKPLVSLSELESLKNSGESTLLDYLVERTGSSIARVRNALVKPIDDELSDRLLAACMGNIDLRNQIKPYANLLRIDPWGYPLVYPANSFVVDFGSDRRETGSHYTPKSLTEAIVAETLTPVVYIGPAEGLGRSDWKLKTPEEILSLKICDPAMGSGAFLVQVCRYLSDKLIEAWKLSEIEGAVISSEGTTDKLQASPELMPGDLEARTAIARRLIAERCLYGVDINPLAVELAKLSIWLITLSKDRPFGFLDHNFKSGDSLLGISSLEQLIELSLVPSERSQQYLFGKSIRVSVGEAIELRKNLRMQPVRDINDIELMAKLDSEARSKLSFPNIIANAFVGSLFKSARNKSYIESAAADINLSADKLIEGDFIMLRRLTEMAKNDLSVDLPLGKNIRRPFHWALEFPEVFSGNNFGFDAVVGNPPYLHGSRVSTIFGGSYLHYLLEYFPSTLGKADFCTYFFRRAYELIRPKGCMGLLLTNSIVEGENLKASIVPVLESGGTIYSTQKDIKWPGRASIFVTFIEIIKGGYHSLRNLNGIEVKNIGARLLSEELIEPYELEENSSLCFKGSELLGNFFLTDQEAIEMRSNKPNFGDVILPFIGGENLTSSVDIKPERWVIFFRDWTLDYCRSNYKDLIEILENRFLKNLDDAPKRKNWWQFHRHRSVIYDAMKNLRSVLIRPYTSNMCWFEFGQTDWVYSNAVIVVLSDEITMWGVLNSSIHEQHTYTYSTRMALTLRYIPSACFGFFPFPEKHNLQTIESISQRYFDCRQRIRIKSGLNLRELYQKFHNPDEMSTELLELRNLHVELDQAVAKAYQWSDISLDHTFVETKQGIRFTVSEQARIDIIARLGVLNHERHNERYIKKLSLKNLNKSKKNLKNKNKIEVTPDLFDNHSHTS